MKIRLYNDGKEKAQSFEVHVEFDLNAPDAHGLMSFTAYGPTANAAQKNALAAIEQLQGRLTALMTHKLLNIA